MTVTRDSDYTLERKSTPLSEFKCPFEARPVTLGEEHTVTKDGDTYECTCGAAYEWESELHYKITVMPPGA